MHVAKLNWFSHIVTLMRKMLVILNAMLVQKQANFVYFKMLYERLKKHKTSQTDCPERC